MRLYYSSNLTLRNTTMKLLTTSILLISLTMATFADKPTKFENRKAKKISKITERLVKIESRKSCMQNATSLEGMQTCRVVKNQNKPFKLKKGMTFEAKKTKIINRITKRISKVTQYKTCVQNSLNITDLKACKPQRKTKK